MSKKKYRIVLYISNIILDSIKKRKTIKNTIYIIEKTKQFIILSIKKIDNYLIYILQDLQLTYKYIQIFCNNYCINKYCKVNYKY